MQTPRRDPRLFFSRDSPGRTPTRGPVGPMRPFSYSYRTAATATSVTGTFVVTDPLDTTGPSATFQIEPSPLSYSLTESGTTCRSASRTT